MDLVASLVATVQAAGGQIGWQELVDSVPYPERAKIGKALLAAKEQGLLKRSLVWDAESKSNLHTVKYIGGA